ncbi:MAG: RagB/SusD family nutrient uptake outer membrane protein [Paludibacter sp.]|nr:RagB/SusD family nutrient uptake outer membrane protein [Paludibacter sp.]
MKNIKNKTTYFIALITIVFLSVSCVNDLNVIPINPQKTQTFNQDEVFAKTYASFALTGQEGPSGNSDIEGLDEGRFSIYRCLWNCNELSTDEAICSWGDAEVLELNFNNWTSQSTITDGLYARLYFTVTVCNHFLEQTVGKTDDSTVKQRAEVRFLRATAYYYLLDFFGNVPFTEVVSLTPPKQIKRALLFAWVEKELLECQTDMYEPRTAPYYRVDKAAAWLLLSRLYLNSEVYTAVPASATAAAVAGTTRWDDAAIYAKKVIDSGYILNPSYRQLFMADNAGTIDGSSVNTAPQEIIFPIAADGVKTKAWGTSLFLIASTHTTDMAAWGTTEGWGGNRTRVALIKKFFTVTTDGSSVNGFFSNASDLTTGSLDPKNGFKSIKDNRALFDKKSVSVNLKISAPGIFKEGYQVIKFTNLRADGAAPNDPKYTDMDVPLMRVAEAYLTYAEAVLRGAAKVAGYEPLTAVNALRSRAGATAKSSIDLDGVLDEKAREFFFEGQRRIDLIRYNRYGGPTGYTWDWKANEAAGKDFPIEFNLFPIPANDLNANPNLTQNPGY